MEALLMRANAGFLRRRLKPVGVAGIEPTAHEQPLHAHRDSCEHDADFLVRRWRQGPEIERAVSAIDEEDAVEEQRVVVDVQERGRRLRLAVSGLDVRPTAPLLPRAMDLARQLTQPVYDCVCLGWQSAQATLVTAYRRLVRRPSARSNGVEVADLRSL